MTENNECNIDRNSEKLTKEEILEKYRKENACGDEYIREWLPDGR